MAIVQWVNLEKDPEYAKDIEIGSVDRCGSVAVKNVFEKANVPLIFKLGVSPVGNENVVYNAAELMRNNNFKGSKGLTNLATEVEVLMDDVLTLPAAGGNKYKVVGKDANGVIVESAEIEAKRKLYYQFMHMQDPTAPQKAVPDLKQLESHLLSYCVVLTKAGTDTEFPFHKTINTTTENKIAIGTYSHVHFKAEIEKLYDLSLAQQAVGCVTVLSNYISSFSDYILSGNVSLGGAPDPSCLVSGGKVLMGGDLSVKNYLWHGLDDEDDAVKRWFVEGAANYTPDPCVVGGVQQLIAIDRADVNISGGKDYPLGGYQDVAITINPALQVLLNNPSGNVNIVLKLKKTDGFSGGFSFPSGIAITTCCTKSWWEEQQPGSSDIVWNHELGHRMGMVAYGNKNTIARYERLPDGPSTLYGENRGVNDKGHKGPHCEKGALNFNAANNEWTGTPLCVLFGATGTAQANTPLNYCPECTPIVRKLDLSKEAIKAR